MQKVSAPCPSPMVDEYGPLGLSPIVLTRDAADGLVGLTRAKDLEFTIGNPQRSRVRAGVAMQRRAEGRLRRPVSAHTNGHMSREFGVQLDGRIKRSPTTTAAEHAITRPLPAFMRPGAAQSHISAGPMRSATLHSIEAINLHQRRRVEQFGARLTRVAHLATDPPAQFTVPLDLPLTGGRFRQSLAIAGPSAV